jgi:hypothetical protein
MGNEKEKTDIDSTADFFEKLPYYYNRGEKAYKHIEEMFNEFWKDGDAQRIQRLIAYIEEGEGNYAYRYIGGVHRILNLLHALQLEVKYGCVPVIDGCISMREVIDKYMTAVFAFRRIYFHLSEESVQEADEILSKFRLSPFVVYFILHNDQIISDNRIYKRIYRRYLMIWDDMEKSMFIKLTGAKI